jgi:hypothetical protein
MKKDYSNLPIEDANKEFVMACIGNNLENLIQLLTNSRLESKIDEDSFCTGFNWAVGEKFNTILKYLIVDYQIPLFNKMAKHLELPDNLYIKNMFEARELKKSLEEELSNKQHVNNKLKL